MNSINAINNKKGSTGVGVVIMVVILLLIIMPFISQVFERVRINIIRNDTTTAVEISLRSALVALDIEQASAETIDFNNTEFRSVFQSYLATNMNLNNDLSVSTSSLVDGDVTINSIQYYGTANLPYTNPHTGEVFTRPYFNVELNLIIKPSLFRKMIHEITGVEEFHYTFYDDVSMPIDN
jgi:Na+-transporting methylmalonyl-CoA/oxaloacetate decarboxylase gamma subunit